MLPLYLYLIVFFVLQIGWFMTAEGDVVSYVNITSLQITDGGRYLCVANNSIGYEEQPAQLNVYGRFLGLRIAQFIVAIRLWTFNMKFGSALLPYLSVTITCCSLKNINPHISLTYIGCNCI